jgi:hypothetical protein
MMLIKMLLLFALLAFVFCITYDPKSGTLEKFIEPNSCCSNVEYRARNPVQCEPPYYQGVQFADPNYGCPRRSPQVMNGAIIGA